MGFELVVHQSSPADSAAFVPSPMPKPAEKGLVLESSWSQVSLLEAT